MVRLKIAYWEFDFEAVCPTLDHDLLSQAHIKKNVELGFMSPIRYYNNQHVIIMCKIMSVQNLAQT